MNHQIEELLTIEQAAKILNVNAQTLRRWDRQGILKAVRVGTRRGVGDRRYRKLDIEAYITRNHKSK
ncbi:MAG: DNA-binding protein, excisionase family [Candidatus Gottesmanbacteria bacterium GW2011_GWA1_42_26]|nr:MAG: DNA-binding protein, excisionase family [Candidatus Gottesmanbacteria bacterium GW2011_GWA1_42_26]